MSARLADVSDLVRLYAKLLLGRRLSFAGLSGLVLLQSFLDALGLLLLVPLVEQLQGRASSGMVTAHGLGQWLPQTPQGLALVVLAIYLLKNGVSVGRIWAINRYVFALWQRWVEGIVEGILYARTPMPSETKSGEAVATALSEAYQCAFALVNALRLLAGAATFVAIYAVLMASSWRLTLGITVLFLFALPIVRPFARKAQRAGSEQVKALERATSCLLEPTQAQREIQGFGVERFFIDRLREPVHQLRRSYRTLVTLTELPFPLLETVTVATFCLLIIGVGQFSPEATEGSLPLLALFGAASFRLYPVLTALGQQWVALTSRQLSVRRVVDGMNADVDTERGREGLPFELSLDFDDVAFAYAERERSLAKISFRLPAGKRLGLAGTSGAGKSTLVALIMGFVRPDTGEIRVDGRPLDESLLSGWRRVIGYVSQESRQFDLSVAENVALGRLDANDERVRLACDAVGIHRFIEELPDGYDTRLGEQGLSLSGGQRQRLSLARAILMRPRLLILDEALSALDHESALQVLSGIRRFLPEATWVMVAHRLSLLEGFDQLLVLRDGRVLQEGSYRDLLETDGHFKRLVELEPQTKTLAKPADEDVSSAHSPGAPEAS